MLYSNLEFNLKDIVYRIHISISSSIICSRRKTSLRSAYPIYVKLYSQNIPQNNLKLKVVDNSNFVVEYLEAEVTPK